MRRRLARRRRRFCYAAAFGVHASWLTACTRYRTPQRTAEAGPGLAEVLAPEVTVPLFLGLECALERLSSHLPEQHR